MRVTTDATPDLARLEAAAQAIPSMNTPFASRLLRSLAREAPEGMAIVEVGTWLGSGTAQLALGVSERGDPVPIHSYDRFHADESEARRAVARGLEIAPESDTRPVVERLLKDFPAEIHLHKQDIFGIRWTGGPIGLYVDDAAKRPSAFYHVLETFAPFWVPGRTVVVLQDFDYWKKLSSPRSRRRYRVQRDFVERHPECFTHLPFEELSESSMAIFLYERPVPLRAIRIGNRFRALTRIGLRT
jgi:hypothetical protein